MKNSAFFPILIFLGSFIAAFTACKDQNSDKEVIARVYGNYLYKEDIVHSLPENLSPEDSIKILRNKTDLWVKKQLLLNQANAVLTDEQKDVEQIVKDYRASLLIDKYKQEFLKQKLDTVLRASEIRDYFEANPESFVMNREILKGYFLKIPTDHTQYNTVRSLAFSDNETAGDRLRDMAENYEFHFVDFRNQWRDFSIFADQMPLNASNHAKILKNENYLTARDGHFFYFLKINDVRIAGDTMPFEHAEETIKILLLNKQKTELLNALERSVYQNAFNKGDLEVYYNR